MTRRRRIWSELVPLPELARAGSVLRALGARDIQLLCAVQPRQVDDALAVVDAARTHGLSVGLWPLLEDTDGRWLHPGNAGRFGRFIEELIERTEARGAGVDTLALDLEPPISEVKRVTEGRLGAARAWLRRPVDERTHRRLTTLLRAHGIESLATAIPPALLPGRAGEGWRRALGTPLGVDFDVVSAMLYTTLFEGYSFGALGRADARGLLTRFAAMTDAGFPGRASVSLGAVGVGALGDEKRYRGVEELVDDVGLALAVGLDDIALFDLAGVLARPPIEPWLDALVETGPAARPAASTARARAAAAGLWVTGVALSRFAPPRE